MKASGYEIKKFIDSLQNDDWIDGENLSRIEEWSDLNDFEKYDFKEIGCEVIVRTVCGVEKNLSFASQFRKWKLSQTHRKCLLLIPSEQYEAVVRKVKEMNVQGVQIQEL